MPSVERDLVDSQNVSIWTQLRKKPMKCCIIGSGNWGTAVARMVAQNCKECFFFDDTVNMYVYEEIFNGRKLSELINETHENPKYLPGVKFGENVRAVSDLRTAIKGCTILVFVVPHQFIQSICKEMRGHVEEGAKAVSLVKGFDCEHNKINLMSEYIRDILGVEVNSLSGANVAKDIANEQFSESTIGYANIESASILQQLFDRPYFRVNCVPDVAGVEICGALKNVVALASGFCDGLGLGTNTKAAILRMGLLEIRLFCKLFYHGTIREVFWESCGMADLITTCFGGRNRRCAEEFVRTGHSWKEIERRLLKGQKLQGTHTTRDVHGFLNAQAAEHQFPLFTQVYKIADCGADPKTIVTVFMSSEPRRIETDQAMFSKL